MSKNKHRKLQPITDEEYLKCNDWNRMILEEFLMQPHFSKDTVKQYTSAGRIFLKYLHDRVRNTEIYKLRPKDGMLYQAWLNSLGLSSSAIRLRRSLVSSLCNYIELYYGEEDEIKSFRNIFPKGVTHVPHSFKNEKEPLSLEEWNHLIDTLEEREEYQMRLYALLSFYSGARRGEVIQIRKECADYEKVKGTNRYVSHYVRGKGAGEDGKQFKLNYGEEVMEAMKKWLKVRGNDDEPALFVRKFKDNRTEPLSREAFNEWCSGTFSEILGRRFAPHDFRRSRATILSEQGMPIEKIQKLLNHQSSETTSIYILSEDDEDMDDLF